MTGQALVGATWENFYDNDKATAFELRKKCFEYADAMLAEEGK